MIEGAVIGAVSAGVIEGKLIGEEIAEVQY